MSELTLDRISFAVDNDNNNIARIQCCEAIQFQKNLQTKITNDNICGTYLQCMYKYSIGVGRTYGFFTLECLQTH